MTRLISVFLLTAALGCGTDGADLDAGMPSDATPMPDVATADAGTPMPPLAGQLLIEELYYAGAVPAGGADHYFSDQFLELVNASDVPLDLSGIYIGEVYGVAGEINPGQAPDSFRDSHPEEVVMGSVWRVPAGVALPPGGHLVVAHDGTNHRPFSTIDLSGAELEAFVTDSGRDQDSPTVDNLEPIHFRGGIDWLITVFGPSLVVLEASAEIGEVAAPGGGFKSAPTSAVLDAIETLMDAASGDFKRLPDAVDTGHAWVSGTYSGESLHRRRDGAGYQDTDDSGADFEVGAPDPGLPIAPDGSTGEPWIELGTGINAYAPLLEGAPLELVAGLQGGWHLDLTARFGGFGPAGVLLVYEALSDAVEPINYTTEAVLRTRSVRADGDGWVRVGDRIVLDITDPTEVVGSAAIVRVTGVLGDVSVSDERTVTIVDDMP
ncbi:MAG: hypothetical protein DRJ42_17350 [Deltaproteobacteria bacterium]|nr:MAG: hypothetical protein DRJ42_17350 [Deltaproteobacteria bacterium]